MCAVTAYALVRHSAPACRIRMPMQFDGSLIAPRTGRYHLWLGSDDGSRLWLDGQLVLDNGGLVSCRKLAAKQVPSQPSPASQPAVARRRLPPHDHEHLN